MSERGPIYTDQPLRPGDGTARSWRRDIQGQMYSFTAVLMPTGERRYFARKFNGYSGGPRFACAWSPCLEWTFPPSEWERVQRQDLGLE